MESHQMTLRKGVRGEASTEPALCASRRFVGSLAFAILVLCTPALYAAPGDYFGIQVVDEQTGRGVPLVELKTVSGVSFWTDSAGWIAINDPDLMNEKIYFSIASHGYEYPKDGFGFRGKAFDLKAGEEVTVKLPRQNIAERLYRITGSGIYRDSVLLGKRAPIEQPLHNGLVQGSDSVQFAEYKGKLHWFWGDTLLPKYPLGIFHMPGATSPLPKELKLDIEQGHNLKYFVDDKGQARNTAEMPGQGPTWVNAVTVLKDKSGTERMIAGYIKIRGQLETYRRGLCQWNDDKNIFEDLGDVPLDTANFPLGHPLLHKEGGREWVYFCEPLPTLRVPATIESFRDMALYEAYTCLKPGSRFAKKQARAEDIERDERGRAVWAWKKDAPVIDPATEARWLKSGVLSSEDIRLQVADPATGKLVTPHRGNVAWNEHRRRWTTVFGQMLGSSSLIGEIWYAEADSLTGPWLHATKIITHEKYDFYNPRQHSVFQKENGRIIYLEGTYTHTFAGNPRPTPRYDYNQIMYKLDLSDARLKLPAR